MKLLLSRMWPEPSKAQDSTESRSLNPCHEKGFFIFTFWLSPQVCYLPCPAATTRDDGSLREQRKLGPPIDEKRRSGRALRPRGETLSHMRQSFASRR
jgi:hypothetical protein